LGQARDGRKHRRSIGDGDSEATANFIEKISRPATLISSGARFHLYSRSDFLNHLPSLNIVEVE
jgi:hypothetical protein